MGSKDRCGICLYWDHRAEAEMDEHTGYCTVHEMLKRDTALCDQFRRRTAESEKEYYNALYNDGTDYESDDMEMDDF